MTGQLAGKVALVTGASRGIGRAIASEFVEQGARVVLASRKQEALDEVVASLNQRFPKRAFGKACHMGDSKAIDDLVSWCRSEFGTIDVLVNNAATNPQFGPMVLADPGAWKKTFDVNLVGAFLLTRRVVEGLQESGRHGSVINVASVLGLTAAPMMGVYAMTKAAIISMTKTLAMELGGSGIRVNALAPGLIETRFAEGLLANDAIADRFVNRTALGRHGQPDDCVGPCVFLASDASKYVTGSVLNVDGGYLCC